MDALRTAQVFLVTRGIETTLRSLILSRLSVVKPSWWDEASSRVKTRAINLQASSPNKELHPVYFTSLTDLLQIVEQNFQDIFGTSAQIAMAELWDVKEARNDCYHSRDWTSEEQERVLTTGRQVLQAVDGESPQLREALSFASNVGNSTDKHVLVPALEEWDPLAHYYGFTEGLLKPLGLVTRVLTRNELSEEVLRRHLDQCEFIWIPSGWMATGLGEKLFDLVVRQVYTGKPVFVQTNRPPKSDREQTIWSQFLTKLGVADWPNVKLWDEGSYDAYPRNIVFRKEFESLRDAALFDGVDEITISSTTHLGGGSLARRVVVGNPTTRTLEMDEWTPISGASAACMLIATHTIVPGSKLRAVVTSGDCFGDPIEDISGRVYQGFGKNIPFAYNLTNWLLPSAIDGQLPGVSS